MKTIHMAHGCCGGEEESCMPAYGDAGACCGISRQFMTKAERREALEAYRTQLKNELAGLEERLQDLKA